MIHPRRRTALLFALAFILISFGLMWGLPNLFDFAQDSVVPMGTLAQRGFAFDKITTFRYPPLHFQLLRLCFLPVRALCRVPAIAAITKLSATLFIFAARLVSVAMALGTTWMILLTGRRLWDTATGQGAALIFVLSPLTLYYAKNANLDIPYVFWLSCALFFYVRILQENRRRDYIWLGAVSALAVCTKDQAYAFLLLMPIPILLRLWKQSKEAGPAGRPRRHFAPVVWAAAAFIIPFVIIHNILLDPAGFHRHLKMITGPGSEGWRMFAAGPVGQLRLLAETVLRLTDAWTPAGLVLAVMGLIVGLRRDEGCHVRRALLVPVVSYHLLFLAVVGYVPTRFVLPMMLVFSLFAGRAITWLWERRPTGAVPRRTAAVILIGWVALAGLMLDLVMSEFSRYPAQKWLERNVPQGSRVCYIGDMRDMPRFNKPLDPFPCEPNRKALAEASADMAVLSLGRGHPAMGSRSTRLASVLRRNLGTWGLANKSPRGMRGKDFHSRLVSGEFGYAEQARFVSPVAAFVPEVAESVNRTIVILARVRGSGTERKRR